MKEEKSQERFSHKTNPKGIRFAQTFFKPNKICTLHRVSVESLIIFEIN